MKKYQFTLITLALLVITAAYSNVFGQNNYVAEDSSNGFWLKKIVTNTTSVQSGQTFYYSVHYRIPPGATAVTIQDNLPPNVVFTSFTPPTCPSGTPAPTISLPNVDETGTVKIVWASVPAGCSNQFIVGVRFPVGITCNNRTAFNKVCLTARLGNISVNFCTKEVTTTSYAHDPWNVSKSITGAYYYSNQTCPYLTPDSIASYKLCIQRESNPAGQLGWGHLNLFNATVTDVIPAGASLLPGSSCVTQNGNTLTWNVGSLTVTQGSLPCCEFKVYYPRSSFPQGSQITNQTTLTGWLGAPPDTCGYSTHTSNQTCIKIDSVVFYSGASLIKQNYNNHPQPGCSGYYYIRFCNTGNTPITNAIINDVVPPPLTALSVSNASTGINVSLSTNIATAFLTSPLQPGGCVYFRINYTIPASVAPNTSIQNCVTAVATGIPDTLRFCNTMTIDSAAPAVCFTKSICGHTPQTTYTPGTVVRFRLRIQNIGGAPLSGAFITDYLDPYLEYISNPDPSYYTSNEPNPPCQSTSNWSGPSVYYNTSNRRFTFQDISIPGSCGTNSWCGDDNGIMFYFIEFNVRIADTAGIGNIPNKATIFDGGLETSVISNICYIPVVSTFDYVIEKSVSHDLTNWASTAVVNSGSTINYRLKLTVSPGHLPLRYVTFVDLLPQDNPGGSPYKDKNILLPHTNRGSAFGVSYNSTLSTTPAAVIYSTQNQSQEINVNNFNPSGVPSYPFNPLGAGSVPGNWVTGPVPPANNKNLGYYFGTAPIGASNPATVIFKADVPTGIPGTDTISCNTFVANGFIRYLINSSNIVEEYAAPFESSKICVIRQDTVVVSDTCCDWIEKEPLISQGFSVFGHNYIIHNAKKAPASPICHVYINITPTPSYTGGGLLYIAGVGPYNGTPPLNLDLFPFPFNHINLTTHQVPTYQTLSFDLGIYWASPNPPYMVSFTVVHCNGDTCMLYDTLNPHPVPRISGLLTPDKIPDSLFAVSLRLKGSDKISEPIKYISLTIQDSSSKIFAAGGNPPDKIGAYMFLPTPEASKQVLFVLSEPLSLKDGEMSKYNANLVWIGGTRNRWFRIQLFNPKGEPVASDSTIISTSSDVQTITSGMKGDEFELLQGVPNPSADMTTVYYMIGTESDISLILYNSIGEIVKTINEGFKSQGMHSLDLTTYGLPSGMYYLKLISSKRSTSMPLNIIK